MGGVGAIEGGGTWFRATVAGADGAPGRRTRIPTGSPEEVVRALVAFFAPSGPLRGLGVACFGPIRLDPGAPDWGHLLATPKPGWAGFPLGPRLAAALGCPVTLCTDVQAAAWGERAGGAAAGCADLAYVTVGTGVGVGVVAGGQLVSGRLHPELGHLRVPRLPGDAFPGTCPFHGDCVEGLASGPALAARWGHPAEAEPPGSPRWAAAAAPLAHLAQAVSLATAPERIVFGGGVTRAPGLLDRIRERFTALEAGYRSDFPAGRHLVAAAWGDDSALRGALSLAAGRPC